MEKNSYRRQLTYEIETFLEKGILSFIVILFVLLCFLILVATFIDLFANVPTLGLSFENFLLSLGKILDLFFSSRLPSDSTQSGMKLILVWISIGRFIFAGLAISFFSIWLNQKLQIINSGKTQIYQQGHTVILGWSQEIYSVIKELVEANSSQQHACLVILAPLEPRKMKYDVSSQIGKTGKTRLIFRQGEPTESESIALVSINSAKSIIILPTEEENSDRRVQQIIKTVVDHPDRRPEPYHIVTILREQKNLNLAKFFGKDEVEFITLDDLVTRLFVQVSCQPVINEIYADLLDFQGQEIYFTKQAELIGKTYCEALFHYEFNTIIGMYSSILGGVVNPPMNRIITAGDYLVLLAEDEDKIKFNPQVPEFKDTSVQPETRFQGKSRNLVLIGRNKQILSILDELNNYFPVGSHVLILQEDQGLEKWIAEHAKRWQNIHFSYQNQFSGSKSENIDLAIFNEILLFVENGQSISQTYDLQAFKTLQKICKYAVNRQISLTLVSGISGLKDMLNIQSELITNISINVHLATLLLCQISENKGLNSIFTDLFNTEGSEIYIKPVMNYINPETKTTFYSILKAAALIGETPIGYIRSNTDHKHDLVLNPKKSVLIDWQPDDQIITLAKSLN